MNVGELKATVAAYLQHDPAYFLKNGQDLLLNALNNARRKAELAQSFNSQRVVASLDVGVDGASLRSAVLDGTSDPVSIKDYDTFYLFDSASNTLQPLNHDPRKNVAVRLKDDIRARYGRRWWSNYRYRPDWPNYELTLCDRGPLRVMINGQFVQLNPTQTETKTLKIDCTAWMDSYTDDADTDWMLEDPVVGGHGPGVDYLMWAAMCECNFLTLSFTPGLDGNLSPPEKRRQEALEELFLWDSMQVESGRQPSLPR